jgi:anti-anti-sigma factor
MSFKIRVHKVNKTPVIEIIGELAGKNVGEVAVRLAQLRSSAEKNIAIDLKRTTFVDSHGLGVFVYCWRLLEKEKRNLLFVRPQGFVLNMLQNTNLDQIFTVVESIEAL